MSQAALSIDPFPAPSIVGTVVPQPAGNDTLAQPPPLDPLTPTIFHEHWWLETVTRGRCEEVQVQAHGRVVGRLPYVVSRRHGLFRVSTMPELTHTLGPAVDAGSGNANTRWLRRLEITTELVARLPRLSRFSQVCHPDTPELFGFQSHGFDSSVEFSAEIAPQGEDVLWRAMRDKTRNVIRRGRERLQVTPLNDPEEFRRFYADNLGARGRASYFDLALIVPLHAAAQARGQARMLGTRNEHGRLTAAVFLIWDQRRMWYFLSSRNPALPDNGAVSLLLWEGLRDAAARGLIFDFDGVASAGAARFFAGFGARIVPRYAVRRSSPFYAWAKSGIDLLRGNPRNFFTAS